eukprot:CAMPEP_0167770726 /NCGR_PEP_ID=MMETSP0110_2-20121227/18097_1 /TAXON_ID=629695 /ORGANISM="Gymnochlora sp., Strain CCMP2014" /LENGTH=559 /DNA_ID=CAMNT_0007659971 /DNA_START=24 /DNA_END=1702 /DNA_ORIENTATION=-
MAEGFISSELLDGLVDEPENNEVKEDTKVEKKDLIPPPEKAKKDVTKQPDAPTQNIQPTPPRSRSTYQPITRSSDSIFGRRSKESGKGFRSGLQAVSGLAWLACLVGLIVVSSLEYSEMASLSETEFMNEIFAGVFLFSSLVLIGLRFPWECIIFVTIWFIWLAIAFVREGESIIVTVIMRADSAIESTKTFVQQGGSMLGAWGRLLAPFLADLWDFLQKMLAQLSLEQKLMGVFALFVIYVCYWTYIAVRKRKDAIMYGLFHISFVVVGPVVLYLFNVMPPAFSQKSSSVILTVFPTVMSLDAIRHVSNRYNGAFAQWRSRDIWLSYWSCLPVLSAILWFLVNYVEDLQVRRLGIAILITAVLWFGSEVKLFFYLIWKVLNFGPPVFSIITSIAPGIKTFLSTIQSQLTFSNYASISQSLKVLWENKRVTIPIGCALLFIIFVVGSRIYATLASFFTGLFTFFVAVQSAQAVRNKESGKYGMLLSFWVLTQLQQVLYYLPIVGTVMGFFQPMFLTIFMLMGEEVLKFSIKFIDDQYTIIVGAITAVVIASIYSAKTFR